MSELMNEWMDGRMADFCLYKLELKAELQLASQMGRFTPWLFRHTYLSDVT